MLKVRQNKIFEIIDGTEREVRLYGVNRAGLEWESRDGQILDSVKYACDEWHANIIRLPVSQDRWFGKMPEQNDENNAEKYRARVDEIIDAVAERGKYLLLDLHWSDLGLWNGKSGQHMMPDEHSLLFWQNAAARYRNHPNVLFGLYNEPHIDKTVDGELTTRGTSGSSAESFAKKKRATARSVCRSLSTRCALPALKMWS